MREKEKALPEMEKILESSIFSLSHNVFKSFPPQDHVVKSYFVSNKHFQSAQYCKYVICYAADHGLRCTWCFDIVFSNSTVNSGSI